MAITLSWSAMPVPGEINFESKARAVFTETKSNGEALTTAVYNLEETTIAAATGIKYVWPTSTERAAESGMSTNDLGLQQDTRQIYRYTGSAWATWYLLDPQALDTAASPEFAGVSVGHSSPLKPLHAKTNNSSYLEITSVVNNSRSSALDLIHTTTSDMVDGFGVQLNFRVTDATASLKLLGRIAAIRDGADTEGALAFYAGTNGAEEFMRINSVGNIYTNNNTLYVNNVNSRVGIGTANVNYLVTIEGSDASLVIRDNTDPASYLQFKDSSAGQAIINKYTGAGNVTLDINPKAEDNVSNASLKVFRSTNTTGDKFIGFYKGDNTGTLHGQIGVDGKDSYFQIGGGNFGVGLVPTANMAGLSIEAGLLTLKETTTPTADAGYGKIYFKSDNKIYCQDGAGAEHQIAFV